MIYSFKLFLHDARFVFNAHVQSQQIPLLSLIVFCHGECSMYVFNIKTTKRNTFPRHFECIFPRHLQTPRKHIFLTFEGKYGKAFLQRASPITVLKGGIL